MRIGTCRKPNRGQEPQQRDRVRGRATSSGCSRPLPVGLWRGPHGRRLQTPKGGAGASMTITSRGYAMCMGLTGDAHSHSLTQSAACVGCFPPGSRTQRSGRCADYPSHLLFVVVSVVWLVRILKSHITVRGVKPRFLARRKQPTTATHHRRGRWKRPCLR
jgi:hypothetical protein